MCSKSIFGILVGHYDFWSSILDVCFTFSFKINQINLLDVNIETVLRKNQINAKTFQNGTNKKKMQNLNCSNFNLGDKMCFIPSSYKHCNTSFSKF